MKTIDDIEIVARLKNSYFVIVDNIKRYINISAGTFYFSGYSSKDIPSELIIPIKFAIIKQLRHDALIELDKLAALNIDCTKQLTELDELTKEFALCN